MSVLANGTGTSPSPIRARSGLDSLILAATDDMRYLTCTTTKSQTNQSPTKTVVQSNNAGRKLRSWDESFEALVAYAGIHGTTSVPVRYKEDTALANWVRYQQRNHDALSSGKRQKLESIGFQFGARNDRQWNEKFQRFQEHIRSLGAQAILRDPELSQWVSTQRSLYKKGLMRQDRQSKLDGIGFVWQANSTTTTTKSSRKRGVGAKPKPSSPANTKSTQKREDQWFSNFKKLRAFHREHKHYLIPCHFEQDEALGIWVSNQRSIHNRGLLSCNRKQLLDDIGFVWRVEAKTARAELYQKQWDQQLELLLQYKLVYGNVEVPPDFPKGGLGMWVTIQKEAGRKGSLDAKRAERLLSIGLMWGEERDTCWTKSFLKLKDSLTDKMSDTVMSCDEISLEDAKQGNWLKLQCVMRNYKALPVKRIYLLEQIGVQWDDMSLVVGSDITTAAVSAATSRFVPDLNMCSRGHSGDLIKETTTTTKRPATSTEMLFDRPSKKARVITPKRKEVKGKQHTCNSRCDPDPEVVTILFELT